MAELQELQRKLESVRDLREIVGAMRNLAATYVRWAEGTLEAVRPYGAAVEAALGVVLDRLAGQGAAVPEPDPDSRALVVVFSSDQGLCGAYNDRVVTRALAYRDEAPGPMDLAVIGHRGRALLALRGVEPVFAAGAPTSLDGIKADVPDLAADIFAAYAKAGAERMDFIYNAYAGMGRFEPEVRAVLPPRREAMAAGGYRFVSEPILTDAPDVLLGRLIEEYFFIELYRALLEGHASENGARLASMTSAASNIEDKIGDLQRAYQSARQDTITSELLDVVGGAEALR